MSKLSFENIDRWLFEWGEGNLSPKQIEELQAFLDSHPELAADVDSWNDASVTPENVSFPNVSSLEKDRKIAPFWMGVSAASLIFILAFGGMWMLRNPTKAIYAENELNLVKEDIVKISLDDINKSRFYTSENTIENSNGTREIESNDRLWNSISSKKNQNLASTKLNISNSEDNIAQTNADNSSNGNIEDQNQSEYVIENEIETFNKEMYDEQYANVVASLSPSKNSNSQDGDFYETDEDLANNSSGNTSKSALQKFSSKVNSFARKVKRMADNPVALTNTKDPIYLIPGKLPSDISFSSAGNLIAPRVQALSRVQWLGEEDQQLMNRLSVDGYVYALRGGIGVDVSYNNYADNTIQNFEAAVTYSPKFSVNKNLMVEPAIRLKMGNDRISASSNKIGSQIEFERRNTKQLFEAGETPIGSSLWYRDLGVGATVHSKWFFVGANVDNILEHSNNIYSNDIESESRAPLDFNATVGTEYLSRRNMLLSTYLTYQNYGSLKELWLGANITVAKMFAGLAINNNLEPAASIGLKANNFMLLYGADYMKNSIQNESYLSHQVTVRVRFKPSPMNRRFLKI